MFIFYIKVILKYIKVQYTQDFINYYPAKPCNPNNFKNPPIIKPLSDNSSAPDKVEAIRVKNAIFDSYVKRIFGWLGCGESNCKRSLSSDAKKTKREL